jgi:bisphosphoglycerate-dependent phosphoglycerate mutase
MTTKTDNFQYSTNYFAMKRREYNLDPEKYAKHLQCISQCNNNRYHSEDIERREEFRNIRKINNQKYYLNRKARLASEAEAKANEIIS